MKGRKVLSHNKEGKIPKNKIKEVVRKVSESKTERLEYKIGERLAMSFFLGLAYGGICSAFVIWMYLYTKIPVWMCLFLYLGVFIIATCLGHLYIMRRIIPLLEKLIKKVLEVRNA